MSFVANPLPFFLIAWGAVTAVLVTMVIYGNALDNHEHEDIFINRKEEEVMAGGQKILVARMERLKKVIFSFAVLSGVLLVSSATVWVYFGLFRG